MKRLASGVLVVAVVLSACGSSGSDSQTVKKKAAGNASTDKLAQVLGRGTLILFTDPKYPPQSFAVKGGKRPASTKCAANQLTAPEMAGYDADSGKLVAKALGVEPCFVTPSWTEVTAGNWGDRWDLAYGSGAIDFDRMDVLYMTQPSYSTPTTFFVPKGSSAKTPADLAGKKVGACAGCTMEKYLRGTLHLPGSRIKSGLIRNPEIVTYDTEVPGLAATAKGKLAGFLCSAPVGDGAIKEGEKLRRLPTAAYYSYKTGYVDKKSGLAVGPFINRVNKIMARLHANGTMKRLSIKYFGADYATQAGRFDLSKIGQHVT
jgi:polar amino acid transport system substrate-binding protein